MNQKLEKNEKHWQDAKLPQWAKDSIASDLKALKLKSALSWPTEARPTPLPFSWGGYDQLEGKVEQGTFYFFKQWYVRKVKIVPNRATGRSYKFQYDDAVEFSTIVCRGDLYPTEKDALLAMKWAACDKFAAELADIDARIEACERRQ